ncbi:MAG TPA: hypothetical protein EYH31_09660 [Anaerolineae bacterium]|nr:hypothetical protein [Anaerolineae bacterium]
MVLLLTGFSILGLWLTTTPRLLLRSTGKATTWVFLVAASVAVLITLYFRWYLSSMRVLQRAPSLLGADSVLSLLQISTLSGAAIAILFTLVGLPWGLFTRNALTILGFTGMALISLLVFHPQRRQWERIFVRLQAYCPDLWEQEP